MSALPSAATSTASATSASVPPGPDPGLASAGPVSSSGSMSLETMLANYNYSSFRQPPPPPRELLQDQVQTALQMVPPAPATERAGVPLLRAAAALYSSEELTDRAATCLSFADRFAKDPNDDDTWLEFVDQCGEWPGLTKEQFQDVFKGRQSDYRYIQDILNPRVPEE